MIATQLGEKAQDEGETAPALLMSQHRMCTLQRKRLHRKGQKKTTSTPYCGVIDEVHGHAMVSLDAHVARVNVTLASVTAWTARQIGCARNSVVNFFGACIESREATGL